MANIFAEVDITVRLTDGQEYHVTRFGPGDMVAFERHFNLPTAALKDQQRVEHVMFLTWSAARRQGMSGYESFDAFIDAIEDFENKGGTVTPGKGDSAPTASTGS